MMNLELNENENIADGDPIVLVSWNDGEAEVISLGTGFTSFENLRTELEQAKAGNPGINIPEHSLESIQSCETFHVFTQSAVIEVEKE